MKEGCCEGRFCNGRNDNGVRVCISQCNYGNQMSHAYEILTRFSGDEAFIWRTQSIGLGLIQVVQIIRMRQFCITQIL